MPQIRPYINTLFQAQPAIHNYSQLFTFCSYFYIIGLKGRREGIFVQYVL